MGKQAEPIDHWLTSTCHVVT